MHPSTEGLDVDAPGTEQRRRTIGATENVILPVHGLRPRPNPVAAELPKLSLTASVTARRFLSHLNVNTNSDVDAALRRLRGSKKVHGLLSTSVPAPDVHVKVIWNRHVNEGLRLEDLDENVLKDVQEETNESDDEDGDRSDSESSSTSGLSEQEVVTRDETNLARHFKKKYRFNEEVAVPVTGDIPTLEAGLDQLCLSTTQTEPSVIASNEKPQKDLRNTEEGDSRSPSFGDFVASPVLHFALEQTKLASSYTALHYDQNVSLPEAALGEDCDFEVLEEGVEGQMGIKAEGEENPFEEEVALDDL
eukprot:GHVN01002103.1.p3 GENE.GHVN01002103.1~~GHVN01002103.1.p3  ORF type:complete len:306 (-),score=58.74 GHVN01002103.1:3346-4263(-)